MNQWHISMTWQENLIKKFICQCLDTYYQDRSQDIVIWSSRNFLSDDIRYQSFIININDFDLIFSEFIFLKPYRQSSLWTFNEEQNYSSKMIICELSHHRLIYSKQSFPIWIFIHQKKSYNQQSMYQTSNSNSSFKLAFEF